jgi:imidazole glycerol-phosphate synthase subunit HisH
VTVAVINTGLCNIDSIARALEHCGARTVVTDEPRHLVAATRVVMPGVGAFPSAMSRLHETGLADALHDAVIARRIPVLGICLGMQLMLAKGDEGGGCDGLGWIDGRVERIRPAPDERVPHVGWNTVEFAPGSPLFEGIEPSTDFYFVHSYHVVPDDRSVVVGRTPFAGGIVTAFRSDHMWGVQFHPEKSQTAGFAVLTNFLGQTALPC